MALRYVMLYFRFSGRRHIFVPWGQWPESSTTLCSETVRQVAVAADRQTTTRVYQNGTPRVRGEVCYLRMTRHIFVKLRMPTMNKWIKKRLFKTFLKSLHIRFAAFSNIGYFCPKNYWLTKLVTLCKFWIIISLFSVTVTRNVHRRPQKFAFSSYSTTPYYCAKWE